MSSESAPSLNIDRIFKLSRLVVASHLIRTGYYDTASIMHLVNSFHPEIEEPSDLITASEEWLNLGESVPEPVKIRARHLKFKDLPITRVRNRHDKTTRHFGRITGMISSGSFLRTGSSLLVYRENRVRSGNYLVPLINRQTLAPTVSLKQISPPNPQ